MKQFLRDLFAPSNLLRKVVFIIFDSVSFLISILLAFSLSGSRFKPYYLSAEIFNILAVFLVIKLVIFSLFKLYDISWRYVSLQDIACIAEAGIISDAVLFGVYYIFRFNEIFNIPQSVLIIDLVLSFLFSSGFKISKRMYLEVMRQSIGKSDLKRTLIIGAGSSGEQFIRDNNRNQTRTFNLVGLIDDDPSKQNLYFQGLKVLGTSAQLPEIIKKHSVDTVLISVLNADRNFLKKIFNISREAGIKNIKVVSTINDITNTIKVGINDIRDIDVSDLIGRQAVSINTRIISGRLKNKRILITGAAGSIGSEIARQVLYYGPEQVAIVDINESGLADLELQLNQISSSNTNGGLSEDKDSGHNMVSMYLCDISNRQKVEKMFKDFRPDVVFHAAAYKHVPVMEKFPEEAVRVNILGTYILATAAQEFGVENFILISTDKAVNPSSIMGVSKRIAEFIVTSIGKRSTANFVAVRFGNVIGSRGSVLPVFMEQIKNGGPITITHPEMKRYFMSIPEAVALVLQAAATGGNGDVFILDMGEPVKIIDLATELILLHNLVPGKDIKIEYTGIREGEKLYEELLCAEEGVISTSHKKILKSRLACLYNEDSIGNMIEEFNNILSYATREDWIAMFKYYVPTFNHASRLDPFDTEISANDILDMQVDLKS
jgi:FlaA1/EpsC-like NDP-sugar epimerase